MAPIVADKSQVQSMYSVEGLVPIEEVIPAEGVVPTHFHAFDEVRTVVEGEMIVDVAGNKMLLRPGDRIIIPANTKHSYKAQGSAPCVSFNALKTW
jgi:quercetin dioxygenase-like cupin family protein